MNPRIMTLSDFAPMIEVGLHIQPHHIHEMNELIKNSPDLMVLDPARQISVGYSYEQDRLPRLENLHEPVFTPDNRAARRAAKRGKR